jgi:hypothetical protein
MIIKRSTTKIDAVYDDKDEAEKETRKQAGLNDEKIKKESKENPSGGERNVHN